MVQLNLQDYNTTHILQFASRQLTSRDSVLFRSQTLPDIRSFTDPSPPLPPTRPSSRPGVDKDSDPRLLHAHERGDLRLHLLLGHPLHGLVGVQVWRVILFGI